MDVMDQRLVAQALNYHGQQLQKVWESERNETELTMMNLKEPNFEIYQQRQKTLSFSDRGKRLKLQQFLAKKADVLYDKSNLLKIAEPIKQEPGDEDFYATMPGLDSFVPMEKSQRIRNFLESLIVGDVIFAQVMGKSAAGLLLKVLCNCSDFPRVVSDLGVKALILNTATVPAVDKKGVTRGYMANDLVCVVVGEVNVEAERVVAVMNVPAREGQFPHPAMGLVHVEDLPDAYRKAVDNKGQSYETIMENSTGFNNPNNIRYLNDVIGLGQLNYSNMVGLRERFPQNEYATELRQAQASKWAFRSVAEGIDHFKAGRHTEAFQCLNKALTVDPRNVEGLVARGALYANSGSFKKAIDDFETALKLNQSHANARKYIAETLFALGRSYEDEKKYEEALKAYENCLNIAPYHEEAKNSIEYIKGKTNLPSTLHTNSSLDVPFKAFESEAAITVTSAIDSHSDHGKKDLKKKRKKERMKRPKKRQRWSSSSSSTSGGGGSSSSSSSSDSSGSSSGSSAASSRSNSPDGDRMHSPGGRKKKHKKDHHGSSLSPLSKRMAQYNNPPAAIGQLQPVPPVVATTVPIVPAIIPSQMPPHHLHQQPPPIGSHDMLVPTLYTSHSRPIDKDDYENKVRKFLEHTKDDSDYEEKVRKFLDETAKWKRDKEKEKKHTGDTEKKFKKKKKEKKAKDKEEKKLRKKKKKEERKKRKNKDKLERDLQSQMPDLEQLESKLNAYYAKVEKVEGAASKRYVDQYNDMNSPLSNSERHSDSNRRDEELRLDKDDVFKSYSERDPRLMQSKKDSQRSKPFADLFDQDTPNTHHDSKLPPLDTAALNAKWKAVQASRREPATQKWQEVLPEKKMKPLSEEESPEPLRPLDKSLNIRKQMQREVAEKRAAQHAVVPTPPMTRKDSPLKSTAPVKYPTPQKYTGFGTKEPPAPARVSSLGHKFQPIGGPSEPPPPTRIVTKGSRSRSRSGSRRPHHSDGPPGRGRGSRSRSRSGSMSSGSSRSASRRSRSRSRGRRSGSYDGRRYSRSRSGSFSHGSGSRSRSRSGSYSRSRSRSPSFRRRPFNRQFGNQRGTYYKPRFQPFGDRGNNRGPPGGRDYHQRYYNNGRGPRYDNRRGGSFNYNQRGGMRYDNRNRGMSSRGGRFYNNRPNFRDGFRDRFRDRRYSRSYSPDPMRKVDEAKERINKIIDEDGSRSRSRSRSPRSRSRSGSHSSPRHRSRSYSNRGRSHSRSRSGSRPRSGGSSRPRRDSHERSHSKQRQEREDQPAPPPPEDEEDYERWGQAEEAEAKTEDTSGFAEDIAPEDKESFLQRMKQRSQNVLIKRAIEARTWYRPTSP